MKHSTDYLYGVDPKQFVDLTYVDALHFKITSAKAILVDLLSDGYVVSDHTRVNEVIKAIKFNKELLEEIRC